MRGINFVSRLGGLVFTLLTVSPALATPPMFAVPAEVSTTNEATTPLGFLTGISRSSYLLGDMWGLRPWLSQYGMSLAISETSEVLGNASGGVKQGAAYDGLTQMILQLDTQRAFKRIAQSASGNFGISRSSLKKTGWT